MKSKILLTGCEGYTGNKILEFFPKDRFEIIGTDIKIKKDSNKDTKKLEIDLRNSKDVEKLKDEDFEYLIHTAADQTSGSIFENNTKAGKNLIDLSKKKNLKGIIFMSSSLVSTNADIQYTRSKIAIENMLSKSGIPHVIVRPDMLYSHDEKKMQEQIGYMRKGFALAVGDGKYLRTPSYTEDLVKFFEKIIAEDKFTNRVYEFGSPIAISQNEMLKKMAKVINKKIRIVHLPRFIVKILFKVTGKVDPEQADTIQFDRVVDLARLKQDFNIIPRDFDQGVRLLMLGDEEN